MEGEKGLAFSGGDGISWINDGRMYQGMLEAVSCFSQCVTTRLRRRDTEHIEKSFFSRLFWVMLLHGFWRIESHVLLTTGRVSDFGVELSQARGYVPGYSGSPAKR
jgi:hypothetical protein